ncbi:MAG: NCS2 family permease [Oscillospiraceae bacterium]|nr:NCS2 family permease [Oscillospiraceae bacterium]
MEAIERFFKVKEHGSNFRTEIMAGLTTFFTMAYIIVVNPGILSGAPGLEDKFAALTVATCLGATVGSLLMAFLANYPFALASGMGLNSFFAINICLIMGYSWQQAFAATFISGILFIVISVTGLRSKIINAIPPILKKALSVGIGGFIAFIGLSNAGIVAFQSWGPELSLNSMGALLALLGIALMVFLLIRKVKGAILIGVLGIAVLASIIQATGLADTGVVFPSGYDFAAIASIGQIAFKMDFAGLLNIQGGAAAVFSSLFIVLISLTMVDLFDTVGTLVGCAVQADMLDKDGNLPRANRALLADAIATSAGACFGTSTVTTYIESASGVAEGGRTGLTSTVTGLLFLLSIFFAPVLGFIPSAATAPALIIVGLLMMRNLSEIDWGDFESSVPAFFTIFPMFFMYSIAEGIGFGAIAYVLVKLMKGKVKEVAPTMWVVVALFLVRYTVKALGY